LVTASPVDSTTAVDVFHNVGFGDFFSIISIADATNTVDHSCSVWSENAEATGSDANWQ